MSIQPVSVLYIDDSIDPNLSRYLDEYCSNADTSDLIYEEEPFLKGDTYEQLLRKESVRTANVVLIDSKLFEEADLGSGMFTGEEFRVILNKLFPYIEVIVISQNILPITQGVVEKCKKFKNYEEIKAYYDEKLLAKLNERVDIVRETRQIVARLRNEKSIDQALVEKLNRAVNGTNEYDELKVSDIDRIVQAFQELIAKG